jgi:hypothetical protein
MFNKVQLKQVTKSRLQKQTSIIHDCQLLLKQLFLLIGSPTEKCYLALVACHMLSTFDLAVTLENQLPDYNLLVFV